MEKSKNLVSVDLDELRATVKEALREASPQKEYLSAAETCELLGISAPTLLKFTKSGMYRRYAIANKRFAYRRSEIEKSLEARRTEKALPDE